MESELERLRKKVENFPSASLYNRLAELARNAGSNDEAEEVCRRCMKEFPRNAQAYVIMAEIESHHGRRGEAMKLLQTAIERDPRSVNGYMMLADMSVADKDVAKAVSHLRQVLAIKPNDAAATSKLAELEKTHGAVATVTAPTATATAQGSKSDGGEPLMPFQGPMTTAVKASTGSRTATLDALCAEPGVRGALVADLHGRVVVTRNLQAGQDELLAALSAEVTRSAQASLTVIGIDKLSTWALTAGAGQVLTFQRDKAFSVVVLADVTVRPAMLELRARQTLIDLGAA